MASSEYLRFVEHPSTSGRTKVVPVMFIHHEGMMLDEIGWNGPWRQYILKPTPNKIWSIGCLEEVQKKIGELMDARKAVI
jgi:hypothetical protein